MNLKNFKNNINENILQRGADYYYEGNIVRSFKNAENQYIFEVEGSESYEVIVDLSNNDEIIHSECDCPYDFGQICKHEVAAYFQLVDIREQERKNIYNKKSLGKKTSLKDSLNNISKDELIEIILDAAKENKILKEKLMVKYVKGSSVDEVEQCRKYIDAVVKKYTKREGFISYRQGYDFVEEMEYIFEKIEETKDSLIALDMAIILFEEAMSAIQYADDSHGEIDGLISNSINAIDEIASKQNITEDIKNKIFNKILEESRSRIFMGWEDYKFDILNICTKFAYKEENRVKLVKAINHLIEKEDDDSYIIESLLKMLFNIIEQYESEEEINKFININSNYTFLREILVDRYMDEANYEKVLELALEGEKSDSRYPGLVLKWKEIRYEVYKKLLLKVEQEKLAKELLFDGNFEYYKELKDLNAKREKTFYNNLKRELKTSKELRVRRMYISLIEEENDLDEILNFVKKNPNSIEGYIDILKYNFKDEVVAIYEKYILNLATYASNRDAYKDICRKLVRYKNVAGKDKQDEVKNILKNLYKKRPAFMDEIGKI